MKNYGKELIIDMHNVKNVHLFNRKDLKKFLIELCDLIDMEREDLHFWDEEGIDPEDKYTEEHLIGTSACQFIRTSNIVIHTLDVMKRVYFNIFSCKDFNATKTTKFVQKYFDGKIVSKQTIGRK